MARFLERRCLEFEPCLFVQPEHKVHVLNSLSGCTLEQVVDGGGHEQLVAILVTMDESLVGVHHLFHVDGFIDIVSEACILVKRLVSFHYFLYRTVGLYDLGGEDATGEVATIGDEIYVNIEMSLHLSQALLYLTHMLVGESLIDAHIARAP